MERFAVFSGRRFWLWCLPCAVVLLAGVFGWVLRQRADQQRAEHIRAEVAELLQRAEQNLDADRVAAARKNYESVLQLSSAEPVAVLFLAGYLQQEGQPEQARAMLSRLGPVSDQLQATADFLLGGLELSAGRAVACERLLLSAHRLNPGYGAPLRDLARLYALQMRSADQLRMLQLLEQIRPLTREELALRLLAGRPTTETARAAAQLRSYLMTDPADRGSLLGLLRTLRQDQSEQVVLAELDRHGKLEADSAALQALRGILQLQRGAEQVSSAYAERLVVNASAEDEVWELAARVAERAGDWEQLRSASGWLVQRQPWQPSWRHFLALACERLGATQEAARQREVMGQLDQIELLAWRMFRPQAESVEMALPVMLELSELLVAAGAAAEARLWLTAAARLQPQSERIVRALAALPPQLEQERPDTGQAVAAELRPILLQRVSGGDAGSVKASDWRFVDAAESLGVQFQYHNGSSSWKRIAETVGGGCAVLDLDGDLWPDLYFAQGQRFGEVATSGGLEDQLFRNLRGQRFSNCTEPAGVHENSHTLAATVGDVDGDGFADVLTACLGTCRLYRNAGDGTFFEATPDCLRGSVHCSSGACFADLNDDGMPEIFVLNYVEDWDRRCVNSAGQFATCDPRELQPAICQLFVNQGDGQFVEVTGECGLSELPGRALGVIAADLTGDGVLDLFVANDGMPNRLLTRDFSIVEGAASGAVIRLADIAARSGVAVPESGRAHAGMGVACADFDHNGFPDLFVTNFYREQNTLYQGIGAGLYSDASSRSGLGPVSLPLLGFGTQPIDVEGDGLVDLVVLNGDIDDYSSTGRPWKMPITAFRNEGGLRFRDLSQSCGRGFTEPQLGRGLSRVDLNCDGAADLVAVRHDGNVRLLLNQTPQQPGNVAFRLVGRGRGRELLGSTVTLGGESGAGAASTMFGGDGFAASSERVLYVSAGGLSGGRLTVRWADGREQSGEFSGLSGEYLCREESGQSCTLWGVPR